MTDWTVQSVIFRLNTARNKVSLINIAYFIVYLPNLTISSDMSLFDTHRQVSPATFHQNSESRALNSTKTSGQKTTTKIY